MAFEMRSFEICIVLSSTVPIGYNLIKSTELVDPKTLVPPLRIAKDLVHNSNKNLKDKFAISGRWQSIE